MSPWRAAGLSTTWNTSSTLPVEIKLTPTATGQCSVIPRHRNDTQWLHREQTRKPQVAGFWPAHRDFFPDWCRKIARQFGRTRGALARLDTCTAAFGHMPTAPSRLPGCSGGCEEQGGADPLSFPQPSHECTVRKRGLTCPCSFHPARGCARLDTHSCHVWRHKKTHPLFCFGFTGKKSRG